MTKAQLDQALRFAQSRATLPDNDLLIFDGYGLPDFKPVYCTVEAVAKLMRWECICFTGGIDTEAFNTLCRVARHKFQIVNPEPHNPENEV